MYKHNDNTVELCSIHALRMKRRLRGDWRPGKGGNVTQYAFCAVSVTTVSKRNQQPCALGWLANDNTKHRQCSLKSWRSRPQARTLRQTCQRWCGSLMDVICWQRCLLLPHPEEAILHRTQLIYKLDTWAYTSIIVHIFCTFSLFSGAWFAIIFVAQGM